jgi:Fic family protein
MSPEAAWAAVKSSRLFGFRHLDLLQADARPFGLSIGPHVQESLHRIDRATGGGPAVLAAPSGDLGDPAVRDRLRIKTLMDEAAESSLIEGAATTRRDAVELLRTGRPPGSIGERMVVNNYVAMQRLKGWRDRPLSVEMLLELQALLTAETLERPDESGRLRRADEPVRVVDERTGDDIFTPPPAHQLGMRLERLCAFANAPHDRGSQFIHPIVKACVLHFMVGYEHPFCDGNGRTARAVFYWFALRNGYGIFEFTAISEIIRRGFAKYPQAYVDSEVDDGDLTYFILYKLDVIEQSLDRLTEHLAREQEKIERSRAFLRVSKGLNLRQRLLLEHALRHPATEYTVKSHMNSNGIVAATARTDLEGLVKTRLLARSKRGKEMVYLASPDLDKRLQRALSR